MFGIEHLGRMLVIVGGVIALLGLLLILGGKIPFLGELPGDIRIEREHFTFSFPLATCLLISFILTIVANIILRLLRK